MWSAKVAFSPPGAAWCIHQLCHTASRKRGWKRLVRLPYYVAITIPVPNIARRRWVAWKWVKKLTYQGGNCETTRSTKCRLFIITQTAPRVTAPSAPGRDQTCLGSDLGVSRRGPKHGGGAYWRFPTLIIGPMATSVLSCASQARFSFVMGAEPCSHNTTSCLGAAMPFLVHAHPMVSGARN